MGLPVCASQGIQQIALRTVELQGGSRTALARQLDHVTDHGDHQVALPGQIHGPVEAVLIDPGRSRHLGPGLAIGEEFARRVIDQTEHVDALLTVELPVFRQLLAQTVGHGRDHLPRLVLDPVALTRTAGPVPQLVLGIVDQGTHQGNAVRRVVTRATIGVHPAEQGQDAVVLQKDRRLLGHLEVELLVLR